MSGDRMVETRLGALLGSGVGVLPMLAAVSLMSLNPASVSAQVASPQVQADYPVTVTLIPNPRTDVTFARDVAPIIQQSCERCHQPGNVSPMVLQTYEQVRLYAALIRDRVVRRQMPPWPIDRTVGITEFKNDVSLSDEEIRTIVDWIDAGAPLGDPANLPEPMVWPDGREWAFVADLGPPDMVLQSPMYNVVANGMDQWPTPITPLEEVQIEGAPLTQDRWIKAVEVRPHSYEARYVFHHANPGLIMPGEIVGITNFSTSSTSGIAASDATYTAHSVTFQYGGSSWTGLGAVTSFDLQTIHTVVPEPSTLVLFATTAACLFGFGWRRKRKTAA